MLKHVAVGLLVVVSPAVFPAPGPAQPTVTDSYWHEDLAEVEILLETGDFAKAGKKLEKLIPRMIERYGAYRARPESFARAVAYRAVTDLAAGDEELARWRWDVARSLSREVRELDLEAFGEPGRQLADHPLRSLGDLPARYRSGNPSDPDAGFLPPVLASIHSRGFDVLCNFADYSRDDIPPKHRFELVVDTQGRPHAPRLLTRTHFPAYVFLALEQIRQWRWEPAKKGGEPVATLERELFEFPCSETW